MKLHYFKTCFTCLDDSIRNYTSKPALNAKEGYDFKIINSFSYTVKPPNTVPLEGNQNSTVLGGGGHVIRIVRAIFELLRGGGGLKNFQDPGG